jgi:predicted RNA binding protein YcfA (HicA-like mRNA interferase family)
MSSWPSAKARRVFAALMRIGWRHDRTVGPHKIMKKDGWADYPFSFHDSEDLGPPSLREFQKRRASNRKTSEGKVGFPRDADLLVLIRWCSLQQVGKNNRPICLHLNS